MLDPAILIPAGAVIIVCALLCLFIVYFVRSLKGFMSVLTKAVSDRTSAATISALADRVEAGEQRTLTVSAQMIDIVGQFSIFTGQLVMFDDRFKAHMARYYQDQTKQRKQEQEESEAAEALLAGQEDKKLMGLIEAGMAAPVVEPTAHPTNNRRRRRRKGQRWAH